MAPTRSTSTPTTPPPTSSSAPTRATKATALCSAADAATKSSTHAIDAYARLLVGRDIDELIYDLGGASKRLIHDSQLRWLGPEKGVTQMACGALVSALWDIRARRENKPLWLLLSEMSRRGDRRRRRLHPHPRRPRAPSRRWTSCGPAQDGKAARIAALKADGYPAYTTSPGWLGYSDEKLVRLSKEAAADGFSMIKLKVGGDINDDRRRMALAREAVGDLPIAIDANQRWEVSEAIEWVNQLAEFNPYWIEEPTSTDDILGHAEIRKGVAPVRVATGEAVASRIVFKQLLQAGAIDVLQLDSTRVGGVNENIANLLLAAKLRRAGLPACRRRGAVRTGPALLVLRLRRHQRQPGRPHDRVRRPPARALRRAGPDRQRHATPRRNCPAPGPKCSAPPAPAGSSPPGLGGWKWASRAAVTGASLTEAGAIR